MAPLGVGACAVAQPVITSPPQSQTNIAGTTVTFSVEATDPLPVFYQWQFNSADLTDQTNTTLVLTNVQTANCPTLHPRSKFCERFWAEGH
jgi:hypothetical protein